MHPVAENVTFIISVCMPAVEESSDTTCKRLKVKNKRSSILLFDWLSVFHDLSLGLSIVGYTSSAFREITRLIRRACRQLFVFNEAPSSLLQVGLLCKNWHIRAHQFSLMPAKFPPDRWRAVGIIVSEPTKFEIRLNLRLPWTPRMGATWCVDQLEYRP